MKFAALLLSLAAVTTTATAKDKLVVLSEADAASLQGKTIALTLHEKPSFMAMTAGKAAFGLFGVGAMISAGNNLVRDNAIADPADIVRSNLANELAGAYGAKLLATDTTPIKADKPAQIAATHPDADFILDVRSGGWMFAYFASDWAHYWVAYSVQIQLIDSKTGRQLSNAACNAGTKDHANPPTREQLLGDGAKLLKDVTASLGWTCVNLLAKDQLHIPTANMAASPAQLVDPLTAAAQAASPSTIASAVVAPSDMPAPASSAAANTAATPAQTPVPVAAPAATGTDSSGNN